MSGASAAHRQGLRSRTPLEAGFSMPAEWSPHGRCWMAWPSREDLWVGLWGGNLELTQRAYAAVARAIRRFEPVTVVVHPQAQASAQRLCGPDIGLLALEIDDAWMRDSGPSFLRHQDGRLAGTAWRFNAWGGKHAPHDQDAQLAPRLLEGLGLPCYRAPLVLEGGAIHVDGEGTVLTTESVVLNANRNPGLTRAEAEVELLHALGASKVVWLPGDPLDAETDGHVDALACFARPGLVVYASHPDPQHPHARILGENLDALRRATDARGRRFELVALEQAVEAEAGTDVFCSSYLNFYIANGGIVMPAYGVAGDDRARAVLERLFPEREVVPVDVRRIAPGGGAIHCITQQQPA